jgi:hypothetical protein
MNRAPLLQLRRIHRLAWGGLWLVGSAKCAVTLAAAVGLGLAAHRLPGLSPRLWQTLASGSCFAAAVAAAHRWLWPLWRADKSLHATAAALERNWQGRRPPSAASSPDAKPPVGSLLALIDLDKPCSTISDAPLWEAARRAAQRYWHGPLTSGTLLAVWQILGWSSLGVVLWGGLIGLAVAWPQNVGRPMAAILGLGSWLNGVPGGAEHDAANRDRQLAESARTDLLTAQAGPADRSPDLPEEPDDRPDPTAVWDPRQLEAWWQMQRWLNEQTERVVRESEQGDPTAPATARLRPLSTLQRELADQLELAAKRAAHQQQHEPE